MTGELQVRVERLPFRFATGVWFWRRHPDGVAVMQFGEHGWFEAVRPDGVRADDIAPSIELPHEFVEPLVAALTETIPPNTALDRHLRDAVTVRDRLLVLVEQFAAPAPLVYPPMATAGPPRAS